MTVVNGRFAVAMAIKGVILFGKKQALLLWIDSVLLESENE